MYIDPLKVKFAVDTATYNLGTAARMYMSDEAGVDYTVVLDQVYYDHNGQAQAFQDSEACRI